VKRSQKLLLIAMIVAVGSLALGASARRDGVLQGTVQGGDPSTDHIQVVIYALDRAEDAPNVNVFQKGPILQKAVIDETRTFTFTLPPEEYVLQVWLNGIGVVDQLIEVEPGRATTVDLEVKPPEL